MYRRVGEDVEVLIAEQRDRITAALNTRLPKGKIEAGESAEEAAVREVAEETGLHSRIVNPLGSVQYSYDDDDGRVLKEVHFYLLEWVDGDPLEPDGELDRIFWCSMDTAQRKLTFDSERRAMGWARSKLEAN